MQWQRSAAWKTISDLEFKTSNNCNALYKAMVFLMWQCDYSAAEVQQLHVIQHISAAKYFRDGAILPLLLMDKKRAARGGEWARQRWRVLGKQQLHEAHLPSATCGRERAYASRSRVSVFHST